MLSERRRLDGFAQMRGRSGRVISRLATLQPKAAANVEIPSPLAGRVRKLGAAVGQMLGAMGSGLNTVRFGYQVIEFPRLFNLQCLGGCRAFTPTQVGW